jgi:hypothetical protein
MHKRQLRPLSVLFVFASILFLLSPTFILTPSMAVAASTPATSDIQLPPHAVWQPWGSDWECKHGYRREGERCVEVNVPPHAFLDYFGHDWECERGYRQEGEGCVPVQVPEHAHLAYSGHDWSCNEGYERVDNICERLMEETLNRAAPRENELTQLATQVYTNRETSHDRQTIEHLQRQLQQAGYDPGPSDGILGPRTLAALQQFLVDSGLTAGNVPQTPPHAPDS